MIRQCVICGAEFDTPPSSNKRTCSPACSAAWRQQHKGRHNKWSASAKRNAAAAAEKKPGIWPTARRPHLHYRRARGPQNRNAKIWHLRTPDGEPVVVTNLTDWARQHTADFGMEPTEASAAAISSGFRQIKRSMEGKFRRANGQPCTVSTYKGWTLVAWEEKQFEKFGFTYGIL